MSLSLAAIFGILLIPHHFHHLHAIQPSSPADYNNYYNDVDDEDDKDYADDDSRGSVHTFNRPGSSFVEYRLDWIPKDSQNFRLDFRFRTLRTNALLLHHTYLETDQVVGCRAEVVVRIQTGTLAVYRIVKNHRTQVIRLGKGNYFCYYLLLLGLLLLSLPPPPPPPPIDTNTSCTTIYS